jgi:hypothetical protein
MIVNFRACGISRGAYKLTRTSTLKKKKKTQNKFTKIIIIFPNSLIRYAYSTYNILIPCVIFFEK